MTLLLALGTLFLCCLPYLFDVPVKPDRFWGKVGVMGYGKLEVEGSTLETRGRESVVRMDYMREEGKK